MGVVAAADLSVDQQADTGDDQRGEESDNGELVILHAQSITAHGGRDDGGDAAHGGDQQPGRPAQVREARKVAQQVLGCAGEDRKSVV